jgi:aspartate/methionine/tyrosine aminotransferase
MFTFARLDRLPPCVFATVNEIKMEARREGQDIIDLGMGNPEDHVILAAGCRLPIFQNRPVTRSHRPVAFFYSAAESE